MNLDRLIELLSTPAAYPSAVEPVEVRQTHISVVFLAGEFVYKIKKPVDLGFLDFRTLEQRHHFCQEEVRLNRRLAPEVYLGVTPVTRQGEGLQFEGAGEVVEWAVKMRRLPEEATLERCVERGAVGRAQIEALARKLAAFHASAAGGAHIAEYGRFQVVARNARENYAQSAAQIGVTVHPDVFQRLHGRTGALLAEWQPTIEARAQRGVPRDTHGDLHLDHVYLFPERAPPGDLVIIDCIEFNERFRFADPVADMAFLVMDLIFHGRRDLAKAFADAYFLARDDAEGRNLLPFYTAYRAAVRAKVEGITLAEQEIPEAERQRAQRRAGAHWLLALGELEEARRRPALLLVGGLPGSGKSTLARGLAEHAGFEVIRSDAIRKELAGVSNYGAERTAFGEGIYTPAWNERTYAECLRRAEELLFAGKRVLVDASFRQEARRRAFLDAAQRWCVPALLLMCTAAPEVIRDRLARRKGDISDADWSVSQHAAAHWEPASAQTQSMMQEVNSGGTREQALLEAMRISETSE